MRRPVIFVALAALAAMLASVVVYSALKKREAEVQQAMARTTYIVVAATNLPLGSKIEPGQVKLARWSADAMPEGAFTNPSQVVGSFVKNQFVNNEPIVATKLFLGQKTAGVMPLLIPPGMRAVSVPVDEVSDIAGFVLPHTHVDILVALTDQATENKPFSKIVLQDVEVLAVAQEVEKKKDEPELVKVVTVLVSPQDAERLELATKQGTLRLAMRNYSDNKIVATNGSDVSAMLHGFSHVTPVIAAQPHHLEAAPRPVKKFQVEIFRNGKSSESVSFVSQALAEPSHHHAAAAEKTASAASAHEEASMADEAGPGTGASRTKTVSASPVAVEPASFTAKGKTIEIP
jgi:pilus assembly protein CpaB